MVKITKQFAFLKQSSCTGILVQGYDRRQPEILFQDFQIFWRKGQNSTEVCGKDIGHFQKKKMLKTWIKWFLFCIQTSSLKIINKMGCATKLGFNAICWECEDNRIPEEVKEEKWQYEKGRFGACITEESIAEGKFNYFLMISIKSVDLWPFVWIYFFSS